jgi:uncharacterized Zn finger protein
MNVRRTGRHEAEDRTMATYSTQDEAIIQETVRKLQDKLFSETKDLSPADAAAHKQTVRSQLEASYERATSEGKYFSPLQEEAIRRLVSWELFFTDGKHWTS